MWALAGVFVWAAVAKILHPQEFATAINHYRILPYPMTVALAVYLPWLELICAAAVVGGWRRGAALGLMLSLLVVFTVALASALIRHLDISCGCFGSTPGGSMAWDLVRDLVLAAIAALLLSLETNPKDETRHPTGS